MYTGVDAQLITEPVLPFSIILNKLLLPEDLVSVLKSPLSSRMLSVYENTMCSAITPPSGNSSKKIFY